MLVAVVEFDSRTRQASILTECILYVYRRLFRKSNTNKIRSMLFFLSFSLNSVKQSGK
jgi:hypothetical protein